MSPPGWPKDDPGPELSRRRRGAMSRRKGRAFEQKIARMLRERLPHATIRRGRQSHRADESVPLAQVARAAEVYRALVLHWTAQKARRL